MYRYLKVDSTYVNGYKFGYLGTLGPFLATTGSETKDFYDLFWKFARFFTRRAWSDIPIRIKKQFQWTFELDRQAAEGFETCGSRPAGSLLFSGSLLSIICMARPMSFNTFRSGVAWLFFFYYSNLNKNANKYDGNPPPLRWDEWRYTGCLSQKLIVNYETTKKKK